jgi:hypothetical protein
MKSTLNILYEIELMIAGRAETFARKYYIVLKKLNIAPCLYWLARHVLLALVRALKTQKSRHAHPLAGAGRPATQSSMPHFVATR